MDAHRALAHEWTVVQHDHERYEGQCQWIKIAAVLACLAGIAIGLDVWLLGALVLVLWLQEGIFKTSQSRLGARLRVLEAELARPGGTTLMAYQLHSEWRAHRPSFGGLVAEYAASACRPTVAFPYLPLILLVLALAQA